MSMCLAKGCLQAFATLTSTALRLAMFLADWIGMNRQLSSHQRSEYFLEKSQAPSTTGHLDITWPNRYWQHVTCKDTMLHVDIPGNAILDFHHLVLDYNGTLVHDWAVLPGVREREGCSLRAFQTADILTANICDASDLLLVPVRLQAS